MFIKLAQGLFTKVLVWCNILAAFALCVAYLSPYVNPLTFWLCAFFGLAYPILFWVNVSFFCFWLFRKQRFFYISLFVLLIGFKNHLTLIGFGGSRKAPDESFRVMSFNARYFDCLQNKADYVKKIKVQDQMLASIKEQNPDILCTQDFTGDVAETTDRAFAFVKEVVGLKYHVYKTASLITFSKFPIIKQEAFSFENSYNSYSYSDIKVKSNQIIRVYNLHLQSAKLGDYASEIRDNITEINEKEKQSFYLGVFGKLRRSFRMRAAQVAIVKKHIESSPYPVIVCGDFNDTPLSFTYNEMSKGLKDSFVECGFGLGTTYGGPLPMLRIDYILTDPSIKIYNHSVLGRDYSDHYAIVSDLQ